MTTLQCLRSHGLTFVSIPQDDEGMRSDILENRLATMRANGESLPKLLFDIPDFHNPTRITMSVARRRSFCDWPRNMISSFLRMIPIAVSVRGRSCPTDQIHGHRWPGNRAIRFPRLCDGWDLRNPMAVMPPALGLAGRLPRRARFVRRMGLQKSDGSSCRSRSVSLLMRSVEQTGRAYRLGDRSYDAIRNKLAEISIDGSGTLDEFLPKPKVDPPSGVTFSGLSCLKAIPATTSPLVPWSMGSKSAVADYASQTKIPAIFCALPTVSSTRENPRRHPRLGKSLQ